MAPASRRLQGSRRPFRTAESHGHQLAMLAPGGAKSIRDLPDRGVGADRLDQCGHQVLVAAGALPHPPKRGVPRDRIALGTDASQPIHLATLAGGVDPLERRRPVALVLEAIHADDDLPPVLDRALDLVGGFLDLALLEATLD